jgi:hypothetical protein
MLPFQTGLSRRCCQFVLIVQIAKNVVIRARQMGSISQYLFIETQVVLCQVTPRISPRGRFRFVSLSLPAPNSKRNLFVVGFANESNHLVIMEKATSPSISVCSIVLVPRSSNDPVLAPRYLGLWQDRALEEWQVLLKISSSGIVEMLITNSAFCR